MPDNPITPITLAEAERLEAIANAATPPPWKFDGYNTIRDAQHRWILCIEDHPNDGSYAADQIAERSAWYSESAANANFAEESRTALPALIAQHKSAMELMEKLWNALSVNDPAFIEAGRRVCRWREQAVRQSRAKLRS